MVQRLIGDHSLFKDGVSTATVHERLKQHRAKRCCCQETNLCQGTTYWVLLRATAYLAQNYVYNEHSTVHNLTIQLTYILYNIIRIYTHTVCTYLLQLRMKYYRWC